MLDSNVSTYIDKDGNVQEVGGGGVDASTLNGVITGSNGITTALNTAGDKVEVGLGQGDFSSPYTKEWAGTTVTFYKNQNGNDVKFGLTATGYEAAGPMVVQLGQDAQNYPYARIGTTNTGDASKYTEIYGGNIKEVNAAEEHIYLRDNNVKTILGQSIYGSGDIAYTGANGVQVTTVNGKPTIQVDSDVISVGAQDININPNGASTEVYVTVDPDDGYFQITTEDPSEIQYVHNGMNDTSVLMAGTKGNTKTIFGNSLYGSGDITAAFNTSYFTLQNNNSSGGTVTIRSGTNKTGSYSLTLPSKETGIIGIAPYLIMKDGLTGSTQQTTVSSGSEGYFSNTRCTLTPGYSYLLVGWVDCTTGDSSSIMATNIRVFSKDGTTKRFERGCRTTLHSGGGCMVVAFYRCENDGDWVRLNTYNYRSSSTSFNGSLSVYRFVEEN